MIPNSLSNELQKFFTVKLSFRCSTQTLLQAICWPRISKSIQRSCCCVSDGSSISCLDSYYSYIMQICMQQASNSIIVGMRCATQENKRLEKYYYIIIAEVDNILSMCARCIVHLKNNGRRDKRKLSSMCMC